MGNLIKVDFSNNRTSVYDGTIENVYYRRYKYARADLHELLDEIEGTWDRIFDELTLKQAAKIQGRSYFDKARSAIKVSRRKSIHHKAACILADEVLFGCYQDAYNKARDKFNELG